MTASMGCSVSSPTSVCSDNINSGRFLRRVRGADSFATYVLGKPDAVDPPVRFDEGRELADLPRSAPAYSTPLSPSDLASDTASANYQSFLDVWIRLMRETGSPTGAMSRSCPSSKSVPSSPQPALRRPCCFCRPGSSMRGMRNALPRSPDPGILQPMAPGAHSRIRSKPELIVSQSRRCSRKKRTISSTASFGTPCPPG